MDRRRRRRRSCRFCSSIAILVRARAYAFLVGGGAAWGTQLPPREFALEPSPPPPNLYIVRIYTYAQRAVCSMIGRFFFLFPATTCRRRYLCEQSDIYIYFLFFPLLVFGFFFFFLYFYHLPVYVYSVCVCRSRIQLYSTHFIALYRHPPPTFIRSSSNGNRAQSFYIHHKYRVRSTVVSNSTPSTNPCILQ